MFFFFLLQVNTEQISYGGQKCVPFQWREERKVCILRTGSWDRGGGGRRRVTEIRYNGERGNYWDHSHNRGSLRSGVSKDIIFITKC